MQGYVRVTQERRDFFFLFHLGQVNENAVEKAGSSP